MNADSIKIETDEDGLHLIVETPEEDGAFFKQRRFDFRITDPEALYDAVREEIGPWLHEQSFARLAFLCTPDESAGLAYLPSDPKAPDFHSVHADLWDAQERK